MDVVVVEIDNGVVAAALVSTLLEPQPDKRAKDEVTRILQADANA